MTIALFSSLGALGGLLLFVADLILYYPTTGPVQQHRTAASYFATIDPGGKDLAHSSMQHCPIHRVMLGGVLGPVAAVFYALGFLSVYMGLQRMEAPSHHWFLPAVAAMGLSLMMTIAGVYHALFAYTSFLSQQVAKLEKDGRDTSPLFDLMELHQRYLKYIYKWAAVSGMVGSLAFVVAQFCQPTRTPWHSTLFVPVVSAAIKKWLKKHGWGGIVLCGGLTNLWNLVFFVVIGLGSSS